MLKVDLKALIAVLEDLDAEGTYQGQLDRLELLLVQAEINPNPLNLFDISAGLELLGQVKNRESAPWEPTLADLEPFFSV